MYSKIGDIGYPVGENISKAIEHIKYVVRQFRTIEEFEGKDIKVLCRGSSGSILGALFLATLKWESNAVLYHVKKPGEESHCKNKFNIVATDILVVIDDFIATGATIKSTLAYSNEHKLDCLILTDFVSDLTLSERDISPDYLICRNKSIY